MGSTAAPGLPSNPVPDDILLVEDNFIIALDLETILREFGVTEVRTANSVMEAIELIAKRTPKFAFIDINLGVEKGFEVAERLRELGVRFMFATGYDETYDFPEHLSDVGMVSKPYSIEAVRNAIVRADGPSPAR